MHAAKPANPVHFAGCLGTSKLKEVSFPCSSTITVTRLPERAERNSSKRRKESAAARLPAATEARTKGPAFGGLVRCGETEVASDHATAGSAGSIRAISGQGMAKPTFSASDLRQETTPMASPRSFNTGPPLSPGEMGQES